MPPSVDTEAALLSDMRESRKRLELQVLIANVQASKKTGKALRAAAGKGLELVEADDEDEFDVIAVSPGTADTQVSGLVYLLNGDIHHARLAFADGPAELDGDAAAQALNTLKPPATTPGGPSAAQDPKPVQHPSGPAERAVPPPTGEVVPEAEEIASRTGRERSQPRAPIEIPVPPSMQGGPLTTTELRLGLQTWIRRRANGEGLAGYIAAMSGNQTMRDWIGEQRATIGKLGSFYYSDDSAESAERDPSGRQENRVDPSYDGLVVLRGGRRRRQEVIPWDEIPAWFDGCLTDEVKEKLAGAVAAFTLHKQEPGAPTSPDRKKAGRALAKAQSEVWDLFMAAPPPDSLQCQRSRNAFADPGPAQSSLFDAASVPATADQASGSGNAPGETSLVGSRAVDPGEAPGPPIGNDIADALQRIAYLSEDSAGDVAEFLVHGTPPQPGALTVADSPGDSVTWDADGLHVTVSSPVPGRAGTVSWEQAARWADTGMTARDKEILGEASKALAFSSGLAKSTGAQGQEGFFRTEAAHAARIIQTHARMVTNVAANSSGLNPPPAGSPGPTEPRWVTQDKGMLLKGLRERSESARRAAREIEAPATASTGGNPEHAESAGASRPGEPDPLSAVPADHFEVTAEAPPADQSALPPEEELPDRVTSASEPVAAPGPGSRSVSARQDQVPGTPGSAENVSVPALPVRSILGCLTAEEFTALVYAEGGDPGFRENRFSRSVATAYGSRVVSFSATGTGLSVSSAPEGDVLRGAVCTWQQLYAELTQEHRDLTRSAYGVIAQFEASEDTQDRADVYTAERLILETRDAVAVGLGAAPHIARIRARVDELTTRVAQRQAAGSAAQAEVPSAAADSQAVRDGRGSVLASPAEPEGEPEGDRSRHRPVQEVRRAVPGPPSEEERDRMSGEDNNADADGPEPQHESAGPDSSYDYVVVREITDSYNDGDLYSYYKPLNRGVLRVRDGETLEEAASRELADQAGQTDHDTARVGIRVYRLGEGRNARPERHRYGAYGNSREDWTEPDPLFTTTVATAQAAVAAASAAPAADKPEADSPVDTGGPVPGAQDAAPGETPEAPSGRLAEAPPESGSGPAVYDYVVTQEITEAYPDGEVHRYLEELSRGVLQVPPGAVVEDTASKELFARVAHANTRLNTARVGIRVYPAGDGTKAQRQFVGDSNGDIRQGWTEPEPVFTTTVAEEVFRQGRAVLAARDTAAQEELSEPPAETTPGDQPSDGAVAGDHASETAASARQQPAPGPVFDEATRTLHMGGITIMAGDGPGSFSDDDLRNIAAAFALPRRRPLPPEPLPAVAGALGEAWQPDPALTGGTPVSVYALPVNAVLGSGLRPNRVANADGTRVKFRRLTAGPAAAGPAAEAGSDTAERDAASANDMDADVVQGTTCGVIPDRTRGWLQAINTGEAIEFVPLAVVAPAGANPFEGLNEIQQSRASRFDAAEAAGQPAALLTADRLMPGDVIVTGDPVAARGTWVVAGTHTAPGGRRAVTVFPAERVHPAARLPELGTPYRNVPPGMSGFILDDGTPLVVRLPERHPAEDAPGGAALFSPWIPPRSDSHPVSVPDPIADLPLNPEIRAGLGNALGTAETAGQFLEAANGLLGTMARDWAPGDAGPAAPQSPQGDAWLAYGRELAQMQKAAAEAAERSSLLRGSRTWRLLEQALGNAGRIAKSAGSGMMRVAGGGLDAFRRVCSGICEVAGSLAFGTARVLPPGRARDAAERLGNRAAGFIARERGFLDRDARLDEGSYSTPEGWTGSPSLRADVAGRMNDINQEQGTDLKLRDLSSPAELGFAPRPSRRNRVAASRVRAAMRSRPRSGGEPGGPRRP